MKKRTVKQQKRDLEKLLREKCLKRDGYKCLWCGRCQRLQMSHIYPRGRFPWMTFNLENVCTLCIGCHLFKWHRSPIEAYDWFIKAFPIDKIKRLRIQSQLPKSKRPKFDYVKIEKELMVT